MTNITLLAIDLAKTVFQLHGVDEKGNCVLKKRIKRDELLKTICSLAPAIVAMEACGSAHYWGRTFQQATGCDIRIISPQFVKPFVKSNKNDKNDAEAIAEAALRPSMNFVSLKTETQQLVQSLNRRRALHIKNRTAAVNHIRGLLAEFGYCIPQKVTCLKQRLIELIDETLSPNCPSLLRELCKDCYQEILSFDEQVKSYDKKLQAIVKQIPQCGLLMELSGVGICSATQAWVNIGDNPFVFKNGRQFAASVGLVPRQYSSGNKQTLGKISKRGDKYLRQLLIHGARAVVWAIQKTKQDTKFSRWVNDLLERRGFNVTVVAIANKNARKIWRTLAEFYQAQQSASVAH